MAPRKTFLIDTCEECCVYDSGLCRLNPPVPINQYAAAYPVVRPDNPSCFAGQAGSKPKPKGKKKCAPTPSQ